MMMALTQLWNDWEIRLLVLLSFTLQIFLFFCGGLRRRSTHMLLSLLLWLAYLLADFVAVYALGLLSRHGGGTGTSGDGSLAFFWAPFLLIHLGGQDTITAFAMEDNELWPRHLLNLLVQVSLAMYVFWKSTARVRLLVPAILVFIAGITKYGERTWALKRASWKALKSSTGSPYDPPSQQMSPRNENLYVDITLSALRSVRGVRALFAGLKVDQMDGLTQISLNKTIGVLRFNHEYKKIEIVLALMYDDFYSKAAVIRTWSGAILRCVAQICTIVAFVLFLTSNKQGYSTVDIVITYVLIGGGFCLEVCAIFMMLLSPWTWAFLEARKCRRLAPAAWSVLEHFRPETRPWWSNSMGQYDLVSSYLPDRLAPIGKIMGLVGAKELWSNFRHSKHVQVPPKVKELIGRTAYPLLRDIDVATYHHDRPNLHKLYRAGAVDEFLQRLLRLPFEELILTLHVTTGSCFHIDSVKSSDSTSDQQNIMAASMVMSNYMLFLLAMHPFMLPVGTVEALLAETFLEMKAIHPASSDDVYEALLNERTERWDGQIPSSYSYPHSAFLTMLQNVRSFSTHLQRDFDLCNRWEAIEDVWVRVLCYAASKSPAQGHAKRLSMGGELLTVVWLMLAQLHFGDVDLQLELVGPEDGTARPTKWVLFRPAVLDG